MNVLTPTPTPTPDETDDTAAEYAADLIDDTTETLAGFPIAKHADPTSYPLLLSQIMRTPKRIFTAGRPHAFPPDEYKYLCVVGSRHPSAYGIKACERLISGLAGKPIVIISGLAIGIDSIAHECALAANLPTIAFPGSGLADEAIYPQSRRDLAARILEAGGALISPFPSKCRAVRWNFPARNQLMAAASHATLIIEGRRDSGSLQTAFAALDLGRDVMAVPGSIFSDLSTATNDLIRQGAKIAADPEWILEELGFATPTSPITPATLGAPTSPASLFDAGAELTGQTAPTSAPALTQTEQQILSFITLPVSRDEILLAIQGLTPADLNAALTTLESKQLIEEEDGLLRPICGIL